MRTFTAPTMTKLHDRMCSTMLYNKKEEYDWITNTDVVIEHVYAEAESMDWHCDIARFWIPSLRWTKMINEYINPEEVTLWLEQISKRAGKIKNANRLVLRTNKIASSYRGNATVRAMGSCMLSVSFSLEPRPTILLHSRTCYLGYLSCLDWSVAYHLGRLAATALGLEITEFRFAWFVETIQYHRFRTIAFPLGDKAERQKFIKTAKQLTADGNISDYPALDRNYEQFKKWRKADKEGLSFDTMSPYRSYQRPRKRFLTEVMGIEYARQFEDGPKNKAFPKLKSHDVADLTLAKIGLE